MSRPRPDPRLSRRAVLALLAAPALARAHDGPHAENVGVAVDGVERMADGTLRAALTVTNAAGGAITLRGVACPEAAAARLRRRVSLLGVEVWRDVDLLRIDPGEQVALAPPDYAIEIAGAPPEADLLSLTLDFGPAGERTVVLFVLE